MVFPSSHSSVPLTIPSPHEWVALLLPPQAAMPATN
jgi:hypothetical protein